jgi:predicted nucleotidyltransferase component of viral defense system
MTQGDKKNLAASIHQRLLNKAKASGQPFNELLHYYAIERFLYRLSRSVYQERFVLKGALVFATWGAPRSRPTRDMDFLAYTSNAIADVVEIIRVICETEVEPDGLSFAPDTVTGERIREQADFKGVRVKFKARLGNAQISMQIDMGFADVVTPQPQLLEYPTILNMPHPQLWSYPRETVIAEKLQALIMLGELNTRMKDFYDLWLLSGEFAFDQTLLAEAIAATFASRGTTFPAELPVGLTEGFAQAKQNQWQAFLNTSEITHAPDEFIRIIRILRDFLWPLLQRAAQA